MAFTDAVAMDTSTRSPAPDGKNGPPARDPERDKDAPMVAKRWEEASKALQAERRDYWLNLSFYQGQQWVWWDRKRSTVQSLPQQWSPLGPGRAKVTVNKIAANLGSVLGRMLSSELGFEVEPTDSADDVLEGARTAEKVLEAYHADQEWEAVRYEEVFDAFLGGTSAVCVEWDPARGKQLEVDGETGKVVGTGDLTLTPLNITEFGLEPNVREGRSARWWARGLALAPEYVRDYYKLDWLPRSDVGAHLSPLQHRLQADSGGATQEMCLVLAYYERPMSGSKGKYVVTVNDRTIHSGPWPFESDELNLFVFRQRVLPGKWVGTTLMNDALPIQFAYNHARSVLAEHMKLTGNARLMAPYGAFTEEDFNDDPSSILWFSPDLGGAQPSYLVPPQLPRWLSQEADTLAAELDDLMHVHAISRGEGFDRASGQALALLSEKDDSPLSAMAMDQRRGWSKIASYALELLGNKATETRKMSLRLAPGIPEPLSFTGQSFRKQTRVMVSKESVVPRSHAAQQAYAKDLWDRKILTDPRKYAKMVGLPAHEFEELLDADAARANRENYRLAQGIPELPEKFDDHAVHIAEHNRHRKSDSYKYAKPEVRKLIDDHIKFHEQMAHEELGAQQARAMANPALAAVPQADEPMGSQVPLPAEEQEAMMLQQQAMAQGGGGGGGAAGMGMQLPENGVPVPGMQAAMAGQPMPEGAPA